MRGEAVPFYGAHQAGIATPAQDRLHFAAFDLVDGARREDVRDLLAHVDDRGRADDGGPDRPSPRPPTPAAPPTDTGEADGPAAGAAHVTFGFGPSLFGRRATTASASRPSDPRALAPLPALAGDAARPGALGGDLCVQACADDPQVAFHAVRNLARIGRGVVVMRWSQLGFGRTSTHEPRAGRRRAT